MKITQYDDTYSSRLGSGETTLVSGSSGGSNSGYGGDVVGSAGSLSVVGLRQTVSLSSNLAPSAAVGNVLTLISVGGTPVAQFAVPSNTAGSFGSNATRVSASSFVGASANSAREDHRHDGIGTVTASSSNTLDRGTLNLRAGSNVSFGLTDSDGSGGLDTLTINTTASGSGAAGASGALVLLEQHTASSSATLDFTTAITVTYDEYMIDFVGVIPATNNVTLEMVLSTNGGSSWDASSNYFSQISAVLNGGSTTAAAFGNPTTFWGLASGLSTTAGRSFDGTIRLGDPGSSRHKQFHGMVAYSNQANVATGIVGGIWTVTTAVNAVRFLMSSGNITSGTIRMYGVAK